VKTIIAGSRSITDSDAVYNAIEKSGFPITEVVSGGAIGVDSIGEQWAAEHKIPIKHFLPQWRVYGKLAGMLRNTEMVAYASAAIVVWDGRSRGTMDLIGKLTREGNPVMRRDNKAIGGAYSILPSSEFP